MSKYDNIREEELKNKVGKDWFTAFDTTKIVGNVDFCVTFSPHGKQESLFENDTRSLLWAEAKRGKADIYNSIVQLILTIGKARTFDKELPPAFLGAFDSQTIAFIPYNEIQEIFYQNDFNWNVTPSNYETKEFKQIHEKVENTINTYSLLFSFETDEIEIKKFIKINFVVGKSALSKIQVDKNNFISIYNKWLQLVKPSIAANWETAKKFGIIDGDFYLADLLSNENETLKDKLYVLLKKNYYEFDRIPDEMGFFNSKTTNFFDNQKAHTSFWNKYTRPPKEAYWDYIVERRDLLVPQDVRERKGSFFTPQIWVEKSQQYLTDVLGENWQDEYYVWDCAAGTGNLLAGLTNKYNIYASTLDRQDVDVMHQRIETMNQNSISGNGANLLQDHIFQFDFLNDSFDDPKVPKSLQDILNDPEKRKKLVIYINPPYAEAGDSKQRSRTGKNKEEVATKNKTYLKYKEQLGKGSNELFTQFLTRIYFEISGCYLSLFSKLKYIQSGNFVKFRKYFLADFKAGFVVPADTFDNVKGKFPIGFLIWNTDSKEKFGQVQVQVFDRSEYLAGVKVIHNYENVKGSIINWVSEFKDNSVVSIGMMNTGRNDFQNQNLVHIKIKTADTGHSIHINQINLIQNCIFYTVRHVFEATWLNDRDQFLYPEEGWKGDFEFQSDCLAFSLFHGQNKISSKQGTNHWIPFTENEVGAGERFDSHFMTDFMGGKLGAVVEENFNSPHPSKPNYPLASTTEIEHQKTDNESTNHEQMNHDYTNHGQIPQINHEPKNAQNDYGQINKKTNNGQINLSATTDGLFNQQNFIPTSPMQFSPEATAVFDAGRELCRYYHGKHGVTVGNGDRVLNGDRGIASTVSKYNPNASLYDIREYFQGRNESGKMNNKSEDVEYSRLIGNLRDSLKVLAQKIQPKVYEYGFLRG